MSDMKAAVQAYQVSLAHRNLREQEADLFQRMTGGLRAARTASPVARSRAIADNRRLWITVVDLLRDPNNALPAELRASLVSIGLAMQREMNKPDPDFGLLIAVNENIAAGLSGSG